FFAESNRIRIRTHVIPSSPATSAFCQVIILPSALRLFVTCSLPACPHPFAFFAKRRGLFPSHVGAGALTRPGVDFFRAAEGNLLSHTCHSEERRDESLLSNTCHSESALAESAFCKTVGTFSKPRRGRCPHLLNTLPFPIVILRQRSPSPREGLPTKDPCIPAQAKPRQPAGASFSRLFAKGCRRS